MKKYFIITLLIGQWINGIAQNWLPTGNGTNNGYNGGIELQTFNGKLIAGGAFSQAGTVNANGVAMWDETNWSIVDSSMNNFFAVRPFTIFRGQLYGAAEPLNTQIGYLVMLDSNFKWHIVPNSNFYNQTFNGAIFSTAVYNNELYVAGAFDSIGNIRANHIAKWDGYIWTTVGAGINDLDIFCLKVYNNELYAGGHFTQAGGIAVNNIARWNGSVWNDVGGGLTSNGYWPFGSMEIYNNELYICGGLEYAGGQAMTNITKWNGNIFSSVGGGLGFAGGAVGALKVFGSKLILGGGGAGLFSNKAGTWDGINYDSLGTGLNAEPTKFEIYNCKLYAGGRFNGNDSINGNNHINGVAVLDAFNCMTSVNEINMIDYSISIYPNPFSSQSTINFSEEQINTIIKITDVLGKEIKKICFTGKECKIDKGEMKAGIYFLLFTNNKGNLTTKKIIIQ